MGEPTLPEKMFLTAHRQTYRNPYGEALYSRLYWPWFFRAHGWRFWVKWLERFGTPLLLGKTTSQVQGRGDALADARARGAGLRDRGRQRSNGDRRRSEGGRGALRGVRARLCGRVQKLILGQTLTTDAGGSSGKMGSQALGNVHNEVRTIGATPTCAWSRRPCSAWSMCCGR
jgi:hypothetical protein